MTNERKSEKKLPALSDLYGDRGMAIKRDDLAVLLNHPPDPSWIKVHNKIEYIPIERAEWLLTRIFKKWRKEVKEVKLIANSVQVIVRIWVLDPITGEWDWNDGAGAAPLITNKGASPVAFDELQTYSVQKAVPAAVSFATKDAVENFGKIFGKDLNRDRKIDYSHDVGLEKKQIMEEVQELLDAVQDEDYLKQVVMELNDARDQKKDTIEFYVEIKKRLTTWRQ